jgi:hypothetical protein
MEGETCQHWYPLMGRQANATENQGDILVIMSFMVIIFIKILREIFHKKENLMI